jgi:hypothetical protein
MIIPEDMDALGPGQVDTGTLWAGGAATAVVAGFTVVAGVFVARGIFRIPVAGPKTASVFGSFATAMYGARAVACTLLATVLLHVLLLGAPRPLAFFAWITALADVAAVAAPFAHSGPLAGQLFTAVINVAVGVAVISLLPAVGRAATAHAGRPGAVQIVLHVDDHEKRDGDPRRHDEERD